MKCMQENGLLKFSLSQAGLYNLAIAMNCNDEDHIEITQPVSDPASDGEVHFQMGGRHDCEEYEIIVQAKIASGKKIREYIFFKAVPETDFIHRYMDDSKTLIECRFKLFMDLSKPADKRYFSITDYFDSDHGTIEKPFY